MNEPHSATNKTNGTGRYREEGDNLHGVYVRHETRSTLSSSRSYCSGVMAVTLAICSNE